jgi:hypothetical protein
VKLRFAMLMHGSGVVCLAILLASITSGCDEQPGGNRAVQGTGAPATGQAAGLADAEVLAAQAASARKVELTVRAPVYRLLPDDNYGLPHQRFLIKLSNNSTVLVAHDTAEAPRVPVEVGHFVTIHGEYIWNPRGGVIHWTHHSRGRHEWGWIEMDGQRYQ